MEIAVIIISVLLIAIVLLQRSSDLFANRKERGFELFITRVTFILGFAFFMLCLLISL